MDGTHLGMDEQEPDVDWMEGMKIVSCGCTEVIPHSGRRGLTGGIAEQQKSPLGVEESLQQPFAAPEPAALEPWQKIWWTHPDDPLAPPIDAVLALISPMNLKQEWKQHCASPSMPGGVTRAVSAVQSTDSAFHTIIPATPIRRAAWRVVPVPKVSCGKPEPITSNGLVSPVTISSGTPGQQSPNAPEKRLFWSGSGPGVGNGPENHTNCGDLQARQPKRHCADVISAANQVLSRIDKVSILNLPPPIQSLASLKALISHYQRQCLRLRVLNRRPTDGTTTGAEQSAKVGMMADSNLDDSKLAQSGPAMDDSSASGLHGSLRANQATGVAAWKGQKAVDTQATLLNGPSLSHGKSQPSNLVGQSVGPQTHSSITAYSRAMLSLCYEEVGRLACSATSAEVDVISIDSMKVADEEDPMQAESDAYLPGNGNLWHLLPEKVQLAPLRHTDSVREMIQTSNPDIKSTQAVQILEPGAVVQTHASLPDNTSRLLKSDKYDALVPTEPPCTSFGIISYEINQLLRDGFSSPTCRVAHQQAHQQPNFETASARPCNEAPKQEPMLSVS